MQIKVIAEIGINHDGDFNKAKKLIDLSKASEVWGVKFQYRNLNRSYHDQSKEIGDESLKHEIKKVYLSPPKILELTKLKHRKYILNVRISDASQSWATTSAPPKFNGK